MEPILVRTKSRRTSNNEGLQAFVFEEEVSCISLQKSTVRVNVCFRNAAVVSSVQRNRMTFNVITARLVREINRVIESCWFCWCFTCSIAEVGEFVHVEPDSAELNFFVEHIEHVLPVLGCVRMEKVNESCGARPNLAYVGLFPICIHYIDSSFQPLVVSSSNVLDPSVDDRDVSITISDVLHLCKRETVLINGKVFVADHIIDISPDCVKGNPILFIIGQNFKELISIWVAVLALMEAKRPERRKFRSSNIGVQFLHRCLGALFSQEKSEVEHSSNHLISDVWSLLIPRLDHIHSV